MRLPMLIDTLRAHGYTIVQVSALMGKTTAEVMPPLTFWQHLRAIPDSIAFSAVDIVGNFIVMVFFVGDILMSARLMFVGLLAVIDRLRKPYHKASAGYSPRVAVLIPAYNEETVIVRTIRSVLNSDYKNLHVIVIDDGSIGRHGRGGVRGLCRGDCGGARAGADASRMPARRPRSTMRWIA